MIEFPTELPRPSQDYSVGIENSSLRTKMDSGRIRQRRRFTNSQNFISVKWDLTDEEFQLFESFAFHALDGGTSWFQTEILTGGGIVTHNVRIQEGKYKASYKGFMGWVVTATLDVEQINRLTADQTFLAVYGEEGVATIHGEVHTIVNETLPQEIG